MAGVKDAAQRAAAVYALEEKIAATHWTGPEPRSAEDLQQDDAAELQKARARHRLDGVWLAGAGLAARRRSTSTSPPRSPASPSWSPASRSTVWKDYLTLHTLHATRRRTCPRRSSTRSSTMYGKTLSGTPQNKERWKRGVDGVTGALGEAVGKLYVSQVLHAETKAAADSWSRTCWWRWASGSTGSPG
jgi:putative endopeptidase